MTDTNETYDSSTSSGFGIQTVWESARIAAVSALRTAPVWVLAGVIGFVAVGWLSNARTPDPTASVEMGLTDQVVWPFFDVVLSETEARAIAAESVVRDELGDALISYEVRRPENIGLVEITVVAATEEDARRGVSRAADSIVDADLALVTERLNDRIAAQQEAEVVATGELDRIVAEIEAATARFVPGVNEATRRSLDQQIQVLQAERDSALRIQLGAREDVQSLELELETTTSQINVSSLSSFAEEATSSRALQLAAAVGSALAAALALNVLMREQGRILDPAHARSVLGLPTLHFPDSPTTSVALARLLYAMREESGVRMVGVAAIPTGADSAHQLSLALKSIGEEVLVTEFGFESTESDSLAFTILDPFDATTIDAQMACDSVLVVGWEKHTRLWTLRRKIQQLEERGLPVRGVLLRREP